MIHNLKATATSITFKYATNFGTANVEIHLETSHAKVDQYMVFGEPYDETNKFHIAAIKQIAHEIDDNVLSMSGYKLWIY